MLYVPADLLYRAVRANFCHLKFSHHRGGTRRVSRIENENAYERTHFAKRTDSQKLISSGQFLERFQNALGTILNPFGQRKWPELESYRIGLHSDSVLNMNSRFAFCRVYCCPVTSSFFEFACIIQVVCQNCKIERTKKWKNKNRKNYEIRSKEKTAGRR